MANLKDIAQKLGVSVSTVSRGLNGGKEISREMTEKILKAADELGYTLQGRGGRATPDWNSAGIIVPEVASEYYARLVHKAKDFLAAKGYSLSAGQYFDVKIEHVDITADEFRARMAAFTEDLESINAESAALDREIAAALKKLEFAE